MHLAGRIPFPFVLFYKSSLEVVGDTHAEHLVRAAVNVDSRQAGAVIVLGSLGVVLIGRPEVSGVGRPFLRNLNFQAEAE